MGEPSTPNAATVRAGELSDQLRQITETTRALLTQDVDAAAQLLASADPDAPAGARLPYEDYQAVRRSAQQRYVHAVAMADELRDALAGLADVAYEADINAAWQVYRRAVAAPLNPPEETE